MIVQSAKAQNQVRIDSLLNALNQSHDTAKVWVWMELSAEYHSFNPNKAIQYGEKALHLAQKLDYRQGIGRSLHYIGTAYRAKLDFTRSRKYFFLSLPFMKKSAIL
ncbi:MAG: hypothetical protein HC880_07375 [Bacteroidia bacterium]|nr:hypothetical protein [Bacteroidia bacterium]